jgi:hypothetical protein
LNEIAPPRQLRRSVAFIKMQIAKRIVPYAGVAIIAFALGMFAAKLVHHQPLQTPWQVLLSFQNQDLYNLSDDRKRALQAAIDSIVGAQNSNERPFFPRMFLTMVNTNGQTRYVLVREQPLMEVPGEPRVRAHVFDSDGKLLTSDEFSGGWRTSVTDVHVARNSLLRQDALVLDGEYHYGPHPSHRYYVLVGDRVVLAYSERNGELKREEYLFANASVAPSIK